MVKGGECKLVEIEKLGKFRYARLKEVLKMKPYPVVQELLRLLWQRFLRVKLK